MRQFLFLIITGIILCACSTGPTIQSVQEFHQVEYTDRLLHVEPSLAQELLKEKLDQPLLVEFSASWCAPCRSLYKPIHKLAADSHGRYRVVTVDVSERTEIMESFGLEVRLPAFLLRIPDRKEPVIQYGSGASFARLKTWLQMPEHPTSVALPARPLDKPRAFRAILIAGSAENANFLQEILWNYSWLQQKGYKEDEIGCFYGRPDILQYAGDREQFDALQTIAAHCHPNHRAQILESIRLSLEKQPDNFYLYITSHGAAPVKVEKQRALKKACFGYAPALVLDQSPEDCASRLGLTPDDLAAVMKAAPSTHKYLVFQGCYTGGFIARDDNPAQNPSALAQLPHVRILTASSSRHASFGCHSGNKATLFGSAYGQKVIDDHGSLDTMDWKNVYEAVSQEVKTMEKKLHLRGAQASDPQYFAN